ncbi:MAG TPA: hypothetical protein VFM96_08145 [Gaiellaceae bacterium]|nr:hypothetical protein [Gaiellaceae bacterium]
MHDARERGEDEHRRAEHDVNFLGQEGADRVLEAYGSRSSNAWSR